MVRARGIAALAALLLIPGLASAATPTPPPVGPATPVAGASALSGIACESATTCEAIGTTSSGGAAVVTVTGGVPGRAVTVPSVPSVDELSLNAIACGGATTCEAVGSLVDDSGDTSAVVVTITRGVPSAPRTVADSEAAQGDDPSLTGIACPSASSCEAVGEGQDAVATQITDGTPSPLSHDQDPEIAGLVGVVCAGTTCDALGSGSDGNGIAVPVSAGSLGTSQEVAGTASLLTGGCDPSGSCELLATDSGGASQLVSDARGSFGTPIAVRSDALTGVACETASTCLATGASPSGNGVLLGIVHGTPATATAAPFGPSSAIACASATTCLVTGSTPDGAASITELGSGVDSVTLNVGGAKVRGTAVAVRLDCQLACAGTVAEAATVGSGRHARRVAVGRATFSLPAAARRSVTVHLDGAGRRLLRRRHELGVQLAVSTRSSGHATLVAIRSATLGHARRARGRRLRAVPARSPAARA